MRIDFGTLAFGYKVKVGGGTPNWATSLGQGKGYKINDDPEIDEILKGVIYSSASLSKISTKIGKGGRMVSGDTPESPIILGAVFQRVYINETLIEDGKYILLVTRDESESHAGRLRFKYGPSNTYHADESEVYTNTSFFEQARTQLELANEACWFVYDISVKNQNELILNAIIVDADKTVEYEDSRELHLAWDQLIAEREPNNLGSNERNLKTCLEICKKPREQKIHPINFIVYGAPGTGKTYSMVDYSLSVIDNITIEEFKNSNRDRKQNLIRYRELIQAGQIKFTTFHQNYGYEEFVQGLRPDTDSEVMVFKTVDGIFKTIADVALNDTESKNYVIIIDEINRANISKVFGELITLIEEDKRWGELNETSVTLQSGDLFAVPNNLYIIGTMNSADKSISLIDAALRRRFDFIEQKPDSNLIADPVLKLVLENINMNLVQQLDSTDLLVGHSYFMGKGEEDLCNILNNNIIPLLYEYFYDNRKKVANLLKDIIDKSSAKIEIVDEKVGRLRVKDV